MKKKTYVRPEVCVFACEPQQVIAATQLRTNGEGWKDGFTEEPGFGIWDEDPVSPSQGSPRMNVWEAPVQNLWEDEMLF